MQSCILEIKKWVFVVNSACGTIRILISSLYKYVHSLLKSSPDHLYWTSHLCHVTSKKMMQIDCLAKIYCNLFFFFSGVGVWRWGIQKRRENENSIGNSAEKTVISELVYCYFWPVLEDITPLAEPLKYIWFLFKN